MILVTGANGSLGEDTTDLYTPIKYFVDNP